MTPLYAAKAYGAVASQGVKSTGGLEEGAATGDSFSSMLRSTLEHTTQATKEAEKQMALQTEGKANLVDVVTAISDAQTSLQTVVAVRDQVLAAYTQIMQMQI